MDLWEEGTRALLPGKRRACQRKDSAARIIFGQVVVDGSGDEERVGIPEHVAAAEVHRRIGVGVILGLRGVQPQRVDADVEHGGLGEGIEGALGCGVERVEPGLRSRKRESAIMRRASEKISSEMQDT